MKPEINTETAETVQTGSDQAVAPSTPCCVSLVWMPGPANGGGGTAEHEEHATHRSWWYDGQTLLVIVERNDGPEASCVRVHADGDMLDFSNAATDDFDFGWTDQDISWWAILDDILPHNAKRTCADD